MPETPSIAYLAGQKLLVSTAGQTPQEISSEFGDEVINRAMQRQATQGWKHGESQSPFGGSMLWGGEPADPGNIPVRFVSLTQGATPDELVYLLHTGTVGGLLTYDMKEKRERRLFHRQQFEAHDLCMSPERDRIACSLGGKGGIANIAIMEADGKDLREITEGDTIDRAPSWFPDKRTQLVYQSAGIGRNAEGIPVVQGPSSIEQLDLASGTLTTLLEDDTVDYLSPKIDAAGNLYTIRRPYEHLGSYSPKTVLMDILLFPFRLVRALFSFLNVFSMIFSGKPLSTAGRKTTQDADELARMVLWGKVVDTRKNLKKMGKDDDAGLVPTDWQLLRKSPDGDLETVAKGVLSYDLLPDGSLVYSNGRHIFHQSSDGTRKKLLSDHGIHWLVCLQTPSTSQAQGTS